MSTPRNRVETTCKSCGYHAVHRGRLLCNACYQWHDNNGTLAQFPSIHTWIETQERIRNYIELRRCGLSHRRIATRLGVTVRSVERYAAAVRAEQAATETTTDIRSDAAA